MGRQKILMDMTSVTFNVFLEMIVLHFKGKKQSTQKCPDVPRQAPTSAVFRDFFPSPTPTFKSL